MKQGNAAIIRGIVEDKLHEIKSTFFYLQHQIKLPSYYRVESMSDDEMEKSIKLLHASITNLEVALEDFDKTPFDESKSY